VTPVLSLTEKKVDMIELLVLRCCQCSAGDSNKHSSASASSQTLATALDHLAPQSPATPGSTALADDTTSTPRIATRLALLG
jgi:hypothetical protein